MTHVVLGAHGVAGRETVKSLLGRGEVVTAVGRTAPTTAPTTAGASALRADLLNPADATRALEGAQVAYFTVGLPYSAKVWEQQWPLLVRNVIDAAVSHGTRLVYLDNIYAYGEVEGPMTEDTPLRATTRKGRVRVDAVRALQAAAAERNLDLTIARSADFYGPGATTSVVNPYVLARAAVGKPGTWFFDADLPHSLTYTPDIGEALATLGTDPQARGGTWHLPSAPALTGRQMIELAGGPGAKTSVMSLGMMRFGGLFSRAARETVEMAYQWTRPSVLDSSRFEAAFGVAPTPLADGFATTITDLRTG